MTWRASVACPVEGLAEDYRVVVFDRRGHFRSTGDPGGCAPISRHAADVGQLVCELSAGPALVFGTSAGGVIALATAAEHPDVVAGMVVHEPPVVGPLPDAAEWLAFADEVYELNRSEGPLAALNHFASGIGGAPLAALPPELEREWDLLFRLEWRHVYGLWAQARPRYAAAHRAAASSRGRRGEPRQLPRAHRARAGRAP